MVLMAMMALVLGIFYGLSGMEWRLPDFLAAHSGWILYVLMFSVGISVGMHHGLLQKLREHVELFFRMTHPADGRKEGEP